MHPDRVADRPPIEQARAARRMAELNEAMGILADPDKRAAYDRRLAGGDPAPSHSPPRSTRPPSDHDDHDMVAVAPDGFSIFFAYAPWLLLVAMLVGIFVFTAYSGGGPSDDADSGNTPATGEARDIRGECVRTSGGFVLVANCAQTPHEGVIVALASDAALCPDELDAWEVPQEGLVACVDPTTASG